MGYNHGTAMKLLQVTSPDRAVRLGVLEGERVHLLARAHQGIATTLDLLTAVDARRLEAGAWRRSAAEAGAFEDVRWADLEAGKSPHRLTVPLTPPEVWGAGVTYKRSADFREEGTGFYDKVYSAERPELFFKASAARCAGPGEPIGRRRDSAFTASEPEVAVVVGSAGAILAFTLANDVSAWDIERENPLYLPQSKVYNGCFSFGPVVVTADEIRDPYALAVTCRVTRGAGEVFSGSASTAQLKRTFPEIVDWLRRSNDVPAGTVLSTGTGIIQPMDAGLEEGDVVTISCPDVGELRNPVVLV
jgi:2-dehydro-3-deoxy-D-arabinonate dehydratase